MFLCNTPSLNLIFRDKYVALTPILRGTYELTLSSVTRVISRQLLAHIAREFPSREASRAANLERNLRDLVGQLVETVAFVELANLLRDHGEEIIGSDQGRGEADLSTSPTLIPMNWWKWILCRRDLTTTEKIVALAIKELAGTASAIPSSRPLPPIQV